MAITSQTQIDVRPASPDDAVDIAKLGAHVFSATFGHSVQPHELKAYLDDSYSTEATTKDISDPSRDMIVATNEDGQIVGFGLLTRGSSEPCIAHVGSTIELQRLYVHPDFHGKGIGKILVNTMENMARKQAFKHMWLGVWEENHKAQRVYEKLGYKIVGDHDFVIGGVIQTDHIMLKEL
ncbi:hypothetical protein NKR23_g1237 [Pleurostoma richardsiae]|uniref:N-acetyltransferase domain-containing protein n=1 Tax=Pleurostoma richardsiae TaxID=41990 RepID=A0AA38RS15_9PEZI|nr:hypothetical protein NKR23_g1237 [Pleurostoma richardsiae]